MISSETKFCCQWKQIYGLCFYKLNVMSKIENEMGKPSALLA